MNDLYNYINENQDFSFSQKPLNEIDALIFSQLAYINFEEDGITLEQASDIVCNDIMLEFKYDLYQRSCDLLMFLAQTKRYKNINVVKFVSEIDVEQEKQFGAVSFAYDDEFVIIAYRGTDDSCVGLKESFNMTFLSPVPSQLSGKKYLDDISSQNFKHIYLCGHSKGGNIAMYSAVACSDDVFKKISYVYNFDGPGFLSNFLLTKNYRRTVDKIVSFMPEFSLVGLILNHGEQIKIVKSSSVGIKQHNVLSWNIEESSFKVVKNISKISSFLISTLNSFVNCSNANYLEKSVSSLFYVADLSEAKTTADLNPFYYKNSYKLLKSYEKSDKNVKKYVFSSVNGLIKEAFIVMFKQSNYK